MRKRLITFFGASTLVLTMLTGCQIQLPPKEEQSLKVLLEMTGGAKVIVTNEQKSWIPPGQAKKEEKVVEKKDQEVVIIGGLVHPVNGKYPVLLTIGGQRYEIVSNHTKYDIYSSRSQVPYLMVKLSIVAEKGNNLFLVELNQVVTEGVVISAPLGKQKGKHKFKHKDKDYVIVENKSGYDLDKIEGNELYFVKFKSYDEYKKYLEQNDHGEKGKKHKNTKQVKEIELILYAVIK